MKNNSEIDFKYPKGATHLNPDEIAGLKLSYITSQTELNAAEQANVLEGETWAFSQKRKNVLTERFMRDLHKRMFGHVWKWAGTYRTTDKSIGVPWYNITSEINKLIEDTKYWITNQTYSEDETAARLHHRLVWIHPFANGNGRWARTMADVLLESLGKKHFSWGLKQKSQALVEHGHVREKYIRALQLADAKEFQELLEFVRS